MNQELLTFARTVYGEAEVGDVMDATAIANVIMNRVRYRNWPDTIEEVCLQPYQFSCWNADNRNRDQLLRMKLDKKDGWWGAVIRICEDAMTGDLEDITRTSTHYYATYLKRPPKWARGHTPVFQSDYGKYTHLFFNDIDTPPPSSAAEALEQQRPLSETRTAKANKLAIVTATVAAVSGIAEQVKPALPVLEWVRSNFGLALIVIGVAVAVFAGWSLWARFTDRADGKR